MKSKKNIYVSDGSQDEYEDFENDIRNCVEIGTRKITISGNDKRKTQWYDYIRMIEYFNGTTLLSDKQYALEYHYINEHNCYVQLPVV